MSLYRSGLAAVDHAGAGWWRARARRLYRSSRRWWARSGGAATMLARPGGDLTSVALALSVFQRPERRPSGGVCPREYETAHCVNVREELAMSDTSAATVSQHIPPKVRSGPMSRGLAFAVVTMMLVVFSVAASAPSP